MRLCCKCVELTELNSKDVKLMLSSNLLHESIRIGKGTESSIFLFLLLTVNPTLQTVRARERELSYSSLTVEDFTAKHHMITGFKHVSKDHHDNY